MDDSYNAVQETLHVCIDIFKVLNENAQICYFSLHPNDTFLFYIHEIYLLLGNQDYGTFNNGENTKTMYASFVC